MKKILLLFVLCAALPLFAVAQEIRASPLEGYWVSNETETEIAEIVFFGNVLLFKARDIPAVYIGGNFTYINQTIAMPLFSAPWHYRLSGNTLNILTDEGENLTLTKIQTPKSPIEGIWREPGENYFLLFTADIMATGTASGCMGVKIIITDTWFQPSMEGEATEAPASARVGYTVRGKSLIIRNEEEEAELIRVY